MDTVAVRLNRRSFTAVYFHCIVAISRGFQAELAVRITAIATLKQNASPSAELDSLVLAAADENRSKAPECWSGTFPSANLLMWSPLESSTEHQIHEWKQEQVPPQKHVAVESIVCLSQTFPLQMIFSRFLYEAPGLTLALCSCASALERPEASSVVACPRILQVHEQR